MGNLMSNIITVPELIHLDLAFISSYEKMPCM